jgi:hypothetical protein
MLSSIFRRWSGTGHPLRAPSDEMFQHLADLYRVAFFLMGDQGTAVELIESVYSYVHRNRLPNAKGLRAEMVKLLLSKTEGISHIHPNAAPSIELAALSTLPYPFRIPLVLDAIGMEVDEIAAAMGLDAAEVIVRQRIGWDLFREAFSAQSPAPVSRRCCTFEYFQHSVTLC